MSAKVDRSQWLEPSDEAVAQRLGAFRRAGVLSATDVHVVDHLGMLVGERDPEVLLGLALAVRAPRQGHICVDLAALREEAWAPRGEQDERCPLLPADREAWIARIARSSLVRGSAEGQSARPFVIDGTVVYADRYHRYQERLAKALRARFEAMIPIRDPGLLSRGLAELMGSGPGLDRQKLAAAMALLRGLTVISGGPGTGKTYTVRAVLTLLWAQWALDSDPDGDAPGPRVSLAAPTGKAAARMKEAIQKDLGVFLEAAGRVVPAGRSLAQLQRFLDGLLPCTLHRLLRWSPAHPTRFEHNAANPIPYDVVVIDETSMVDLALMAKLVDAVAQDCRLILLGDQHQLSSVEAGTVLADLCGPTLETGLRVSRAFAEELREVAGIGDIAASARLLEDRGPWDAIVQLDRSRRFSPDSGIGQLARACLAPSGTGQQAAKWPKDREDVTVLAHGPSGSLSEEASVRVLDAYGPYLQRLRAGPGPGESLKALHADVLRRFDSFRILCAHRQGRLGVTGVNDAVIHLLQRSGLIRPWGEGWMGRPVLVTRNDYIIELYNGDVGIVVGDERGEAVVAFPAPGDVRYVPPARLPEHQTVYAMTIHKSQGSEFEHAMIVLPDQPSPVLTRELIYTGVTRAKSHLTLVGSPSLLSAALRSSVVRASGLRKEVWGVTASSAAAGSSRGPGR